MGLPPDSEKEHQQMVLVSQEGTMTLDLQVLERLLTGISCGYLSKVLGVWVTLEKNKRQQHERGRKWKRHFQSTSCIAPLKTLKGDQMAKDKHNFQSVSPSNTKKPVKCWNQS